jgi:hypothetical protein
MMELIAAVWLRALGMGHSAELLGLLIAYMLM